MAKSHTTSYGKVTYIQLYGKVTYNQLWQSHVQPVMAKSHTTSYGKVTYNQLWQVTTEPLASVKLSQSLALDPTMLLHLGWSQISYGTTVPHNPAVKMIHHVWLKKKYFLLPCGHV